MKQLILVCGAILLTACAHNDDASFQVSDREVLADGVICETIQPLGTRLKSQRLCTTQEDRDAMRDDTARLYRNLNDNRQVSSARN